MNEINPVEYGKLVNSVDNLERKVDAKKPAAKKVATARKKA